MGLFDSHDEFYDNRMGANITHARHALAIDEKRVDIAPTLWRPKQAIDLKQIWFTGYHGDVGGGYPPDEKTRNRSADVALRSMLSEAAHAGLSLESHLLNALTDDPGLGKFTGHASRCSAYVGLPCVP